VLGVGLPALFGCQALSGAGTAAERVASTLRPEAMDRCAHAS
jgi:hypothetical protein